MLADSEENASVSTGTGVGRPPKRGALSVTIWGPDRTGSRGDTREHFRENQEQNKVTLRSLTGQYGISLIGGERGRNLAFKEGVKV